MQNSETKFLRIFEKEMYRGQLQLSDAKLRTDDGCTFDVHRIILTRSSEYFRTMFCGMDTERRKFKIPGISGEILSDILCYVYTGDIQLTERNARDLIIGADYLLLENLRMEIKQNIKANLTEVNCFRILQAAHQISDKDIFRECFRFIQTRFEGVMRCQNDDIADLPLDILESILSNRSLNVYHETTVWKGIVKWTQKDITARVSSVPQLLLNLDMEDVGEELATAILQHEIVSENFLMKDLIEKSSNDFTSNLDVLLSFLRSYSTRFTELNIHRLPLKLHVMLSRNGEGDEARNSYNLYITYDENLDLCRKIKEISFKPKVLSAIGHTIYMYANTGSLRKFWKFDLCAMDWVRMSNCYLRFFYDIAVVTIDAHIYVLGKNDTGIGTYVYDTVSDRWFNGIALPVHIYDAAAVAIDKKIYVVGNTDAFDALLMQVFDTVTQKWSRLPAPAFNCGDCKLVAYHHKIYLKSHSVFDPSTNLWKKLPDLPYTFLELGAVVFDNQIIFYDSDTEYKRNTKSVRWNDAKECWETLEDTYILKNLHLLHLQPFCTIDHVETIRMITKQNRGPEIQMEKRFFN